jgi:hypothetical protein
MRWIASLGLVLMVVVAGCASPIVGATCKYGLSVCSDRCADLSADFRNCGACGHDCGRFVCDHGACSSTPRSDGGVPEGGLSGDASLDGSFGYDGGVLDGGPIGVGRVDAGHFSADAGLGGCSLGEQECGPQCVDPAADPNNCGSCGVVCPAPQFCAQGACTIHCDPPLTACGLTCLDASNDPDNCGGCGNNCASGICEAGGCADAVPGHVVVIGHDFLASNTNMRRIAGNAVFLARGAPVRVLAYRGDAPTTSISGVEAAINQVKAETGRNWQKIDAIESIVPLQLRDADVFLIHAQLSATKSTLAKLGQEWGNALAQFLVSGGVVVLFEGPSTKNDGTYRVLQPAAIFSAASRSSIANQQLNVLTPGIDLAARTSDRYMSARDTVHFSAMTTPGTTVVVDKTNLPVVVHRVIVH